MVISVSVGVSNCNVRKGMFLIVDNFYNKSLEKYNPSQNLKEYDNYSIELNLPIVKYLTELQGGTIRINSIYKKGTEVIVSF